jgi:hypothetical protein
MKTAARKAVEQIALGCLGGLIFMVGPFLDAISRH